MTIVPSENTNNRWARRTLDEKALGSLHEAELRFPISLLAISRESLVFCEPDESASDAARREHARDFERLPVEESGKIIGLFERHRDYENERVRDVMEPLNERIIMSADTSMLRFLEEADQRQFVFLVEGDGIMGAVTLSDIQQLEARPAMFLRLTLFELLQTRWMRRQASDTWYECLTREFRKSVDYHFGRRREAGEEIDKVAAASLNAKNHACLELGLFDGWDDAGATLESFVDLRDQLAHAHEFALCPKTAAETCAIMRDLRKYIEFLEAKSSNTDGS